MTHDDAVTITARAQESHGEHELGGGFARMSNAEDLYLLRLIERKSDPPAPEPLLSPM